MCPTCPLKAFGFITPSPEANIQNSYSVIICNPVLASLTCIFMQLYNKPDLFYLNSHCVPPQSHISHVKIFPSGRCFALLEMSCISGLGSSPGSGSLQKLPACVQVSHSSNGTTSWVLATAMGDFNWVSSYWIPNWRHCVHWGRESVEIHMLLGAHCHSLIRFLSS